MWIVTFEGKMEKKERVPVEILEVSIRTHRVLDSVGILFIDELEQKTAADLLGCRGFGLKCLREIRKELARYGTSLKHDYVANTENEKKLIESLPTLIGEMAEQMRDFHKQARNLYLILDQLHFDMKPKI